MIEPPVKLKPPPAWRIWENPIFLRYLRSRLRMKGLLPGLLLTLVFSVFFSLITPVLMERGDQMRVQNEVAQQARRRQMEMEAPRNPEMRKALEREREREQDRERRRERERERDGLPPRPPMSAEQPAVINPEMHHRMALLPLLAIQALLLFVIGTGQVAGGMAAERDEGMVDYQRLVPMTPLTKTLGYLIGLPVREWALFLVTLPFAAVALWRGRVPLEDWAPVALIFFTSVILYHLTGLVTGTVMKNRRWAFLLCMGMIFLLYFLVPQGARFGLPFLRYMTMWPALMESMHLLPEFMREWGVIAVHTPGVGVDFFQWRGISDVAFTLIVQGSFIVTMLVMVWRRWRQPDSHLLSKAGASLVFLWLCILPLGNALPGIEDGSLFPGRSLRRFLQGAVDQPTLGEAIPMCGFYGLLMLLLVILLVILLTPNADTQARGLRRAAKLGQTRTPFFTDASSSFVVVVVLTACAAGSWGWFTHSVLASSWFHADPGWQIIAAFFGVLAPVAVGMQTLLETRGGKWPFLAILFLGIVPLLAALVVLANSHQTPTAAAVIAGASPLVQPFYAAEQAVPLVLRGSVKTLHESFMISIVVWPSIYAAGAVAGMLALRRHWKKQRRDAGMEPKADDPTVS